MNLLPFSTLELSLSAALPPVAPASVVEILA